MTDIERSQVRCLLVGPPSVGKSTLFEKLTNGNMNREYSMTSRIAIRQKSYVQADSRQQLEVALLDSPGKDLYQKLVEDIFKKIGPKGIVVAVFDVTNRASIGPLESFFNLLNKQSSNKSVEQSVGILVANKIDLADKRIVTPLEGQQKAKMLKLRYFECSALNDITMQEFDQLLVDLVQTNLAPTNEADRNLLVKTVESNL